MMMMMMMIAVPCLDAGLGLLRVHTQEPRPIRLLF
jgi:hypothetical protein